MSLFQRATDMLTANIHEWIDRCEDPERMLKQFVRELEAAAELAMNATAKAIANERLLERQLAARRQQRDRFHEQARAAVVRGDDAAARVVLAARLRHDRLVDACESQQEVASQEAARFRQELDDLRSRVSEARETMHLYAARQRIAVSRRPLSRCAQHASRTQATWGRFDRVCEHIDRDDAESTALLELLAESVVEVEQPFDETIDQELQALKLSVAESKTDHERSG